MDRRRKKKESPVKMVFLIMVAVLVMVAAIFVVKSVFDKISSDYKQLDFSKEEETMDITINTEEGPSVGWNETDQGWKYYLDGKSFVKDEWRDIDGFLYYFNEDGIMATGELSQEGQIFTLHDTKGYLKNMEVDLDYVPESTGENLDSLVRTNAFWCFLEEGDGSSLFRTILYRKTVENKIMVLGGEMSPERTTRHSMRAYGDYVYYLPKVKESQLPRLSEAEKGLCDKLFRMRPGSDVKELIAEQVDGYMVLDQTIYYSQAGQIHSAVSGVEQTAGEGKYFVVVKDDSCYLVDGLGNPAVADSGNSVMVGDRIYRIEEDGKINDVKHGQLTIGGKTYYLSGNGAKATVNARQGSNDTILIRETHGVQSYCIVDNEIYYSAYVDKGTGSEWYSQIFKTDLDGQDKQEVSDRFPGAMKDMYYYEDEGEIFAEYSPTVWNSSYGVAAVLSRDGSIYKINDSAARTGKHVDGNDMLKIAMAKDGKVICLWQDCEWNKSRGITRVLWNKAIELDGGDRSLIDSTEVDTPKEDESGSQGGDEVVVPIATLPVETPEQTSTDSRFTYPGGQGTYPGGQGAYPGTTAAKPGYPVTGTEKTGQDITVPVPTVPAPVIPPVPESTDEIRIVPIG